MLIDKIGYNKFKNLEDKKMGYSTDHSGNYITPNGSVTLLKHLYDEAKTNSYDARLIAWMKNTIFHDRLDRDINPRLVAHKIGNYGGNVHDIGIFYTNKPYILTVYTNNATNATEIISKVSDIVYNQQIGQ